MILATTVLMAVLGAQAPAEPQARAPQTDETVPVARGTRLAINNFAGEVHIRTWDKDALRVQANHSARTRVNIQNTAAGVTISAVTSRAPGSIDYTITAPGWMAIKVNGTYNFVSIEGAQSEVSAETVRGDIVIKGGTGSVTATSVEGEVIVEGARGRITAHSVNEGIRITNTSGDISAETVNGAIMLNGIEATRVEVSTVNGDVGYSGVVLDGGRYRIATHNGDITMSIPETSNATFTVRTHQGQFSPALPVKGVGEARRGARAVYTLGTGSAEVELESFNGAIRLRRAETVRGGSRE